jgi:7-cyano-7-deazaguanine synthase in queuosine biosynthesis
MAAPDQWHNHGFVYLEDVIERWNATGERGLVLASGGFDSAYMLWRLSQEVEGVIPVHHVFGGNPNMDFMRAQQSCLMDQIAALGNERFDVHKTLIHAATKDDEPCRELYLFPMLSVNLAKSLGCKTIVIGDEEYGRGSYATASPGTTREIIAFREFIEMQSGVNLGFGTDITDLTAAYAKLPPDVASATWSCRFPKMDRHTSYRCGSCKPCRYARKSVKWGMMPPKHTLAIGGIHGTVAAE